MRTLTSHDRRALRVRRRVRALARRVLPFGSWAFVGFLAAVSLGACDLKTPIGQHDGGPRAEPCGVVTCAEGLVCCNASCGICTEPGQACIEIACTGECGTNDDCGAGEYCRAEAGCGTAGTCEERPDACNDVLLPVCGCDGVTYGNACEAAVAGVTVAEDGACPISGACDAMDAAGEGPCDAVLGVVWDGTACIDISGCECTGEDCDAIFDTQAACEEAFATCEEPSCDAMDARAVGECAAIIGIWWNGSACVAESGCECEGSDCDELFETQEACEAAYAACEAPACEPMDARAVGACAAIVGIWWDGVACVAESGCSCEGSDCDELFETQEACEAAFAACPAGCRGDDDCGSDEHCYFADGRCGIAGECSPVPPGLPCGDADPLVCGCDGVTYDCRSAATSAGASVLREGSCAGPCDAMDAVGEGPCDAHFGTAFNGTECVDINGCSCEGADCGRLYADPSQCAAATSSCGDETGALCGGFAGLQCTDGEFCDYEPGDMCGAGDASGRCRPRPDACPGSFDPVTGCDGNPYGNECLAHAAGTDAADP